MDHQIEIYDEQESNAHHPILRWKTNVHIKLELRRVAENR